MEIGSIIGGALRAVLGFLGAILAWLRGRPRLAVAADWGVSSPGTLTLTVRNPSPRKMRVERLYLVVYSSRHGTQTFSVPPLSFQTEVLPKWIDPGEPVRFHAMLQLLDRRLKHHGYDGLCRITPVAEDGLGKAYKGVPIAYDITG